MGQHGCSSCMSMHACTHACVRAPPSWGHRLRNRHHPADWCRCRQFTACSVVFEARSVVVYVHACVCTHARMHARPHKLAHTYTRLYAPTRECADAQARMRPSATARGCTLACTHTHTHATLTACLLFPLVRLIAGSQGLHCPLAGVGHTLRAQAGLLGRRASN